MSRKKVKDKVFSERGEWLRVRHSKSLNSRVGHGVEVVVDDGVVIRGHKCPKCNRRVRGKNHDQGMHHKGAVPKKSRR